MKSNPQRIYEILTNNNGDWVKIDDICKALLLTRREVNNCVNMMGRVNKDLYKGLAKKRVKTKSVNGFGSTKHAYEFKFKVEV